MILPIIIISIICILFVIPVYSENYDYSLSGDYHDYSLELFFSDGIVKGTITNNEKIINLDNSKLIERNSGFLIIDKENDLKMISKKIGNDKQLVIIKIKPDTKLRFIATIDSITKNIGQRDLFSAMNEKLKQEEELKSQNMSFRELQLQEKQNKLDEALKKYDDRQNKIKDSDKKESIPIKTGTDILADFEKSKIKTGMGLVTTDTKKEKKITTSKIVNNEIKSFLSVPPNVQWKKELKFDVLVTDDSGHRYNPTYKAYVGNELKDVLITGKITNPSGKILQNFNGVTDSKGKYYNKFLIPDNSITRGEYTISINSIKTFKDKTNSETNTSKTFFVFSSSGSSNSAPIANAGIDKHLTSGSLVTLDGSNSNDLNDSVLFYTWSQTNGTTVPLSDKKSVKPTFTIPDIFDWFNFSLIVNDGRKNSIADSVIITSLHSDAGIDRILVNGTDVTINSTNIILDGSLSGDALGHAITFDWSVLNYPTNSTIRTSNLTSTTTVNPEFMPDQLGNYILRLIFSDDKGLRDTDQVTITVNP